MIFTIKPLEELIEISSITYEDAIEANFLRYQDLRNQKPNDTYLEIRFFSEATKGKFLGAILSLILTSDERVIKNLEIQNCSLSSNDINEFSSSLISHKCITNLDLSANILGDRVIDKIIEILKNNNVITTLILNSNAITDNGVKQLGGFLENSQNRPLDKLSLSGNGITDPVPLLSCNIKN